jgi:hypothetical protein
VARTASTGAWRALFSRRYLPQCVLTIALPIFNQFDGAPTAALLSTFTLLRVACLHFAPTNHHHHQPSSSPTTPPHPKQQQR